MLKCTTYNTLDHLIPPTLEADKELNDSLLRLESLSACAIVRNTNNCKWLSEIPKRLHYVLWKAYLRDEYYSYRDSRNNKRELELSDLRQLVYHWPEEIFILKEIMPNFPAKLSWFSLFWHEYEDEFTPLYNSSRCLEAFYCKTTEIIFETFTKSKSKYCNNIHTHECKIRKLNISGFNTDHFAINQSSELRGPIIEELGESMSVTKISKTEPNRKKKYQKKSELLLEPKTNPFAFGNAGGKLEVIVDAEVLCDDINQWVDKSKVFAIHNFNSATSNTIYSCGNLVNYGRDFTNFAMQVNGKVITKETESIYVGEESETKILEFMNAFETSHILSFGSARADPILPINFLQYLKNLQNLEIKSNNLHGKLEPLLHMENGLRSLCLYKCNLHDSDLGVLLRSKHKFSLLELNLGINIFNENISNMIKLCQDLPKVITLNLEKSKLGKVHENDVDLLCDSIKSLPNLVHLNFTRNYFSMDNIKIHLTSLRHSPSLRLLELQMPIMEFRDLQGSLDEKYCSMKQFSDLINTKMNKERSELLYVDFGDDLKIEDYRYRDLYY